LWNNCSQRSIYVSPQPSSRYVVSSNTIYCLFTLTPPTTIANRLRRLLSPPSNLSIHHKSAVRRLALLSNMSKEFKLQDSKSPPSIPSSFTLSDQPNSPLPQPQETTGTNSPANTKNSAAGPAQPPSKSSSSARTKLSLSRKQQLSMTMAVARALSPPISSTSTAMNYRPTARSSLLTSAKA
jgi:hypothetical protein